jgi:hypothetical protein
MGGNIKKGQRVLSQFEAVKIRLNGLSRTNRADIGAVAAVGAGGGVNDVDAGSSEGDRSGGAFGFAGAAGNAVFSNLVSHFDYFLSNKMHLVR